MKIHYFKSVLLIVAVLLLTACGANKNSKPIVTVTVLPQQYFAEKIAGDHFQIHTMVPQGSSPESFDPSPSALVQLSNSQAYFRIGYIGFELAWMDKLIQNNPQMKIYDTSKGAYLLDGEEHGCSDPHHHHECATDPHIWNSPKNAVVMAANMRDAFIELDPTHRADYEANYQTLLHEIQQTQDSLATLLKDLKGDSFLIYHPALTYWAHDFGLNQYSIENGGKEPSAASIKALIDSVRIKGAHIIFIQQEFDSKNAQTVATELGLPIKQINPLNYQWSQELIEMAQALKNSRSTLSSRTVDHE